MNYLGKELEKFSNQIEYTVAQYQPHGLPITQFSNILICGLGGSGIAGRIVKAYFQDKFPLPIDVVSDYKTPAYVNAQTLVIASSYSGNTEETLAMYEDAKSKGATIIVLSTGGKIAELAKRDDFLLYIAESGFQPRVALGYSFTNLILIFSEFLGHHKSDDLKQIAHTVSHSNAFADEAGALVVACKNSYKGKYIIVADPLYEAVAIRFTQQLQENAKVEAFVSVVPEANHNVIETYYGKTSSNFIFLNSGANSNVNRRFGFLRELLERNNEKIVDITIKDTSLTTMFNVIYTLDWVSLQIAQLNNAVSNKVDNIAALKFFLDKK